MNDVYLDRPCSACGAEPGEVCNMDGIPMKHVHLARTVATPRNT